MLSWTGQRVPLASARNGNRTQNNQKDNLGNNTEIGPPKELSVITIRSVMENNYRMKLIDEDDW